MSPHSEVVLRHGVLFIIGQPEADFRRPTSVSFAAYTSVSSMLSALFSDLEKAVEELSQLLEEQVETDTIKALRSRMVDKTVSCLRQRPSLP